MDAEYRKAFFYLKRFTKAPSGISYTRGYSRGYADKEPARKAYDYILKLQDNKKISFKEKLNALDAFLEVEENKKSEHGIISYQSGYFTPIRQYIKGVNNNIEKGLPIITKRP